MIGDVDIQNFLNARRCFEEFRLNLDTEQNKAGAIQAFEFTYEAARKIMKKLLEANDITISSSRECFREAAIFGMISDAKVWFDFIRIRNLTSHIDDFLLRVGYHE